MKIKIVQSLNRDWSLVEDMEIDGKNVLNVYPLSECPEDAVIGRDLVSCVDVYNFMVIAYEAGKSGDKLEYEFTKKEEK